MYGTVLFLSFIVGLVVVSIQIQAILPVSHPGFEAGRALKLSPYSPRGDKEDIFYSIM